MRGNETPGQIVTNFCTGVRVHDVITSANFYDRRLWGLSVVGGQILGFSIDSRHRPYNTSASVWLILGMCFLHPVFLSDVLSDVVGVTVNHSAGV